MVTWGAAVEAPKCGASAGSDELVLEETTELLDSCRSYLTAAGALTTGSASKMFSLEPLRRLLTRRLRASETSSSSSVVVVASNKSAPEALRERSKIRSLL